MGAKLGPQRKWYVTGLLKKADVTSERVKGKGSKFENSGLKDDYFMKKDPGGGDAYGVKNDDVLERASLL